MGDTTAIAWTHATANFWLGCQKVSPGCEHCYAEHDTPVRVHRAKGLELWGPPKTTARHRTKGAWRDVPALDRAAAREGVRKRLFVSSLADIFEDHPMVAPWRAEALELLASCTSLDVQLLTKRPEHIRAMVPPSWLTSWPEHVWIGCTVEDQRRARERIPELLKVPARVRFLSCEPLLEAVALDLRPRYFGGGCKGGCIEEGEYVSLDGALRCRRCEYPTTTLEPAISWVIVGGESGPGARPFDLAWARSLRDQCREAGVAYFTKQVGARPVDSARAAVHQPCIHDGSLAIRTTIYAADAPEIAAAREASRDPRVLLTKPQVQHPLYLREHFRFDDRAGADISEWPSDLRIQEFPNG